MQKLFTLSITALLSGVGSTQAQTLQQPSLYESFNYTAGDNIGGNTSASGTTTNNWTTHSNSAVGIIAVQAGSLTAPDANFAKPTGNKVSIPGTNGTVPRDVNRNAALPANRDSTYYSSIINILDNTQLATAFGTTNSYFMHLGGTSGTNVTTLFARLGAIANSSGFQLGIADYGNTYTTNPTVYPFGTPLLVVVRYIRVAGGVDNATLWVNPTKLGGAPPAISDGVTNSSTNGTLAGYNSAAISICIRNASATPNAQIDEIRVGTTYASVTPTTGTWVGGTSTDWFTASNWIDNTVPTASTNVTIPAGVTNSPTIGSGMVTINKLTLTDNAVLTDGAGASLTVNDTTNLAGTFTGAGTVLFKSAVFTSANGNFNPGYVIYNGTTRQRTSGYTTSDSVRIDNPAGVDLVGNNLGTARLILANGVLTTGVSGSSGRVIVTSPSVTAITGASANSYIDGVLQRAVNTTGVYTFPVGNNGSYNPASVQPTTTDVAAYDMQFYSGAGVTPNPTSFANSTPMLASVDKTAYWDINRSSGSTSPVNVTLPYSSARGVTSTAQLVVAHYITAASNWEGLTTNAAVGNATSGTITAPGVSSFSPFTIGATNAQPLPVTLTFFDVTKKEQTAVLNWKLATAESGERVLVQRSPDGQTFATLSTSLSTEGSSQNSYTDASPVTGMNYYRLALLSASGKVSYSSVVHASFTQPGSQWTVFPNPAKDNVFIDIQATPAEVSLVNLTGQQLKTQTVSAKGRYTMSLQDLPSGMYTLKLISGKDVSVQPIQVAH